MVVVIAEATPVVAARSEAQMATAMAVATSELAATTAEEVG